MKAAGATGVYLDNADILYMVESGFEDEETEMIKAAPSADAVYQALEETVKTIQTTVGLTVMPNGGDTFVRRFVRENPGFLKAVNQESVLFEDFRAQRSSDTRYLTNYLDWCKQQGIYIRGIEYVNTAAGVKTAEDYYTAHGWQELYISRHKNLEGD